VSPRRHNAIFFARMQLGGHLYRVNTTGRWAPILVVVAAVVAGIHAIDPSPVGVFYDDAHYVILGRALAFGDGYRYLNVPGAPVGTHFPPGYPALLAVLWRVSPDFPENVALFKMANAFLLGAVALSVYWMARRLLEITTLGAAFAALASTLAVPALLLSSSVISEIFFLALLLPTLVVAERVPERGGIREAALLGFAAGALCLVRSHAVALLPAIAIGYAVQKRFRAAAVFGGIALLALVPWILWVQRFDPLMPAPLRGQYGSYGAWLADGLRADGTGVLFMAARENVVTTWAIIARSFSLANRPLLDVLAVTGVCVLCAAGVLVFARRARIALLFLAFYLAIVLAWPFSPLRFIWGVWPLLVLLMVSGAIRLWRVDRAPRVRNAGRAVSVAMGTIVLVGALLFNVRGYANSWWATVSR
jgi:hypothetical protein